MTAELSGGCGRRSVVALRQLTVYCSILYSNRTSIYLYQPTTKTASHAARHCLPSPSSTRALAPSTDIRQHSHRTHNRARGATAQVTTQYNIKATADEPGEYHLALSGDGDEIPAWWEVAIGGKAVEGIRVLDDR